MLSLKDLMFCFLYLLSPIRNSIKIFLYIHIIMDNLKHSLMSCDLTSSDATK